MATKLIRFDWAMKKILRHKANYGILEGFLSELLRFDVTIESILESEGNKEERYDKSNRVDILVRSTKGELMLVEVQNDSEVDYFHRMLYGVSTLATEYIKEGEVYGTIRKIFSINIVYFGLGQGDDYVYEYKGNFVGTHKNDVLLPTSEQKKRYSAETVADIFPKYYILKINNFDEVAKNTLDEWIYFLKNSEVKESFTAKGLDQAKEKLLYEQLSADDKIRYKREQKEFRIAKSVEETKLIEAESRGEQKGLEKGMAKGIEKGMEKGLEKGIEKGEQETRKKIVENAIKMNLDNQAISNLTGLSLKEIEEILKQE